MSSSQKCGCGKEYLEEKDDSFHYLVLNFMLQEMAFDIQNIE